jgi:hypothetical protein
MVSPNFRVIVNLKVVLEVLEDRTSTSIADLEVLVDLEDKVIPSLLDTLRTFSVSSLEEEILSVGSWMMKTSLKSKIGPKNQRGLKRNEETLSQTSALASAEWEAALAEWALTILETMISLVAWAAEASQAVPQSRLQL